ncbi:hypothetical protein BH24ACI5_BH24ACI5_06770 [soil metagenome]
MLFDIRNPLRLHVVCLLNEFMPVAKEIASRQTPHPQKARFGFGRAF